MDNATTSIDDQQADLLTDIVKIGSAITGAANDVSMISAIENQIKRYLPSTGWNLYRVDPDKNELYCVIATGADENKIKNIRIPIGEGIAGKVAENNELLFITDVNKSEHYSPEIDKLIGSHTRSVIAVPLVYQEKVLGVIEIINPSQSTTSLQLKVLTTIADFSAVAINNLLLRESHSGTGVRDTKLHELFSNIAISITVSLNQENVIKAIMEQVELYFKPDNWSLFKVEPETKSLYFTIAKGLDINQVKKVRIPFGEGIVGTVAISKEPLLITDVKESEYFSPKMDQLTGFVTKSIIAVPIIYQNEPIGVIELINKDESDSFGQQELDILRTIADFSAIAIMNSHNYQQLCSEIEKRKQIEKEMVAQHETMLDISRRAGMADVATSMLHNVGNILNSANVSVDIMNDNINNKNLDRLLNIQTIIETHSNDINSYLTDDEKGKLIPKYLASLIPRVIEIHDIIKKENGNLMRFLQHIRQIIAVENEVAGTTEMKRKVFIPDLFDNAIVLCFPSNEKNTIEIVKNYNIESLINTDKVKLLQILINLIKNSRESLLSLEDNRHKKITLSCTVIDAEHVELTVMDNGRGIAPEVLKKMFTFGFTTKVNGHGYGMHNSYLAAKALGGSLTVSSDGVGCGAKFTLTIMNQPVD